MATRKPLIMVSNDDGITSRGIKALVEVMAELGDVVVVAPDSPQSGMGHAITIGNTLRLFQTDIFKDLGVQAWECSGTPADCVKLGKHYVLKDRSPDLVVSGINHGSNSSISILYSGTMSAAIEASIEGIPAIGFSLCDFRMDADFSHTKPFIEQIAREVLANRLPEGVCLNVNIPAASDQPIKGVRICRQARARYIEEFDERLDPMGRPYFWLSGHFKNDDQAEDTDEFALANNYVSVVPSQFDLTAYHAMASFHSRFGSQN